MFISRGAVLVLGVRHGYVNGNAGESLQVWQNGSLSWMYTHQGCQNYHISDGRYFCNARHACHDVQDRNNKLLLLGVFSINKWLWWRLIILFLSKNNAVNVNTYGNKGFKMFNIKQWLLVEGFIWLFVCFCLHKIDLVTSFIKTLRITLLWYYVT